jgi:diguanylate cyclase
MPFLTDSTEVAVEGIGAARRIGWMRFVGNGLGAIPIASIISNAGRRWPGSCCCSTHWPGPLALLTQRSRQPAVVQFRCMVADSFFGGGWIAFMGLSAVPSALFARCWSPTRSPPVASPGDARHAGAAAGLRAHLVGARVSYQPVTSQRTIVLSVPFLFVYGIGLSILSWQLAPGEIAEPPAAAAEPDGPAGELANRGFLILRAQQALDRAQGRAALPAC